MVTATGIPTTNAVVIAMGSNNQATAIAYGIVRV
jgi:hypothetical protein